MRSLMCTQPYLKTGSKKRKRNSLENTEPGAFPGSWWEQATSSPLVLPTLTTQPALISSAASYPLQHSGTHANNLGKVRILTRSEKTQWKDLLNVAGFQAGSRQVHCCLKDREGGEVHPNTDVLWVGGLFTASREQNDGRGQIKQAHRGKAVAAWSTGNLGLCTQGNSRAAAAPCGEERRHALEYRHCCCFFSWLGACWQVMGSRTTIPNDWGPDGLIYEVR